MVDEIVMAANHAGAQPAPQNDVCKILPGCDAAAVTVSSVMRTAAEAGIGGCISKPVVRAVNDSNLKLILAEKSSRKISTRTAVIAYRDAAKAV